MYALKGTSLKDVDRENSAENSVLAYIGKFSPETILSKIDPGNITPADSERVNELLKEYGQKKHSILQSNQELSQQNKKSIFFTGTAILGGFICGVVFVYFLKKMGYNIF